MNEYLICYNVKGKLRAELSLANNAKEACEVFFEECRYASRENFVSISEITDECVNATCEVMLGAFDGEEE